MYEWKVNPGDGLDLDKSNFIARWVRKMVLGVFAISDMGLA